MKPPPGPALCAVLCSVFWVLWRGFIEGLKEGFRKALRGVHGFSEVIDIAYSQIGTIPWRGEGGENPERGRIDRYIQKKVGTIMIRIHEKS